jgi:small-conductance mechanosensitive channel
MKNRAFEDIIVSIKESPLQQKKIKRWEKKLLHLLILSSVLGMLLTISILVLVFGSILYLTITIILSVIILFKMSEYWIKIESGIKEQDRSFFIECLASARTRNEIYETGITYHNPNFDFDKLRDALDK